MGIRDLVARLGGAGRAQHVTWKIDPAEGIDFIFDATTAAAPDQRAFDNPFFGLQYAYLKGLHEQGYAARNANGFTVRSEHAVEQGDDFFELFELPPRFGGSFRARIQGSTGRSAFAVALDLVLADGSELSHYRLAGPFLQLSADETCRLSPAEWRALVAVRQHAELAPPQRDEYENNWLIFQLQLARKAGMAIDLAHFNQLELLQPDAIGVQMEELDNGDLLLTPSFGRGLDIDDVKRRLGQMTGDQEHCILRVKDRFVLLDQPRLEAAREILTSRTIPKQQVAAFLAAPTAYLNAAMIDLDTGFSLRVHGAERFSHRYFGDVEATGIDWFATAAGRPEPAANLAAAIDSADTLLEARARIADARTHGADTISLQGRSFDIADAGEVEQALASAERRIAAHSEAGDDAESAAAPGDEPAPERAVVAIDSNDEQEEFVKAAELAGFDPPAQTFATDNLKRQPFPHQVEGIQWLLAHLKSAGAAASGGGALLADDMGLGKTFMALVAVAEAYRRSQQSRDRHKPTLIVAPLSLIENWQAEVDDTFRRSPFSDIVVLQTGGDLRRFRVEGARRETEQVFSDGDLIADQDRIRYSLKVGGLYGPDRLDMPGRLVLTTYQTLRDYQFSLSRVDWGVAVFDEAQNLKNPNALATRAAKALKADFKLLATGTPVENSLKDFWCLMDTAAPGLLGAWQAFRSTYIAPILAAEPEAARQIKIDVGRQLRQAVGEYMLRRTKEEKLQGLPAKRLFSGDAASAAGQYLPLLAGVMAGAQLEAYDDIIHGVQAGAGEDRRGAALAGLHRLKVVSIHPDIEARLKLPERARELRQQAARSAKMAALLALLREIEGRGEKVLIFATTKAVQAYAAALIAALFKVPVEIINGDTRAVASARDAMTRKAIIDRFQHQPGFGAIVMSPIAAGVGLTVVGANNVIHLERHWNPAKEAQATDRVYRIGQTRDVNVYLPMALHPAGRSFDLHLNSLLANKVDLSDAVVAAESLGVEDLQGCFG